MQDMQTVAAASEQMSHECFRRVREQIQFVNPAQRVCFLSF